MRLGPNCRNSPSHWSRTVFNKVIDDENDVPCNTTLAMSEKKIYLVQTIAKLKKNAYVQNFETKLGDCIVDVISMINKVIDNRKLWLIC